MFRWFFTRDTLVFLGIMALFFTGQVHAWSAKGHAVIVQDAYQQLTAKEQAFFDNRAVALLTKNGAKEKQKWRRALQQYSALAQIGVWPDVQRELKLTQLFKRFAGSKVPRMLSDYAHRDTSRWHYVNSAFWDHKSQQLIPAVANHSSQVGRAPHTPHAKHARCNQRLRGDLTRVWPHLISAYKQTEHPQQQAILIAFIIHLLADAHQPLHGFAAQFADCSSDLGGNKHCLMRDKNGRCQMNLHRLWDYGFGVFDEEISTSKSSVLKTVLPEEVNVQKIVQTGWQFAPFVYQVNQDQPITKAYDRKAKRIVDAQRRQATETIAIMLKYLYRIKH